MKMNMQYLLLAFLLAFTSPSLLAQAHQYQIGFHGLVRYQGPPPCTPDISGQMIASNTVNLPQISTTDLPGPGDTVGDTRLRFRANGCTGFNINHMWVYFSTNEDVDADGRVIPQGPQGSGDHLRFEFLDEDSGNQVKVGQGGSNSSPVVSYQGTAAPFSSSHLVSDNRVAEKTYVVRYYTPDGNVKGGNYSAVMTANFKYY